MDFVNCTIVFPIQYVTVKEENTYNITIPLIYKVPFTRCKIMKARKPRHIEPKIKLFMNERLYK